MAESGKLLEQLFGVSHQHEMMVDFSEALHD